MNPTTLLTRLNIHSAARISLDPSAPPDFAPGGHTTTVNPAAAEPIASVGLDDAASYDHAVHRAREAFLRWRSVPAPVRGHMVRDISDAFRAAREDLGALVSLEMGKIRPEGEGEVQEAIDIADFSVGLSRQLYGLTIASERPDHRMIEQWHPLGPIGVISAFNFPVAVWAWNAMVAATCGDTIVWKPSLATPLTSIATHRIVSEVAAAHNHPDVFQLVIGADDVVGERMIADRRLPLISATGSCRMGRHVGQAVAARLGRCLLELGGNNAVIITADADLDLATRAVVFGAIGTAGQRCTSTRRLLLESPIADDMIDRLAKAYDSATIGDPLQEGTLVGPLISERAVADMMTALDAARAHDATIVCGGERLDRPGHFVTPAIVRVPKGADLPIARQETFAPILYVFEYDNLDDAVAMHNDVDQGLSSAIFTSAVRSMEQFLGPAGSDCGIANVNLGTSGAEIGGAFGGEKDTGGGRESGSDSWKAYMRRQTCTINAGADLPLAQGITFG
jgi:aldehyde dehydrogenase (NAD+)